MGSMLTVTLSIARMINIVLIFMICLITLGISDINSLYISLILIYLLPTNFTNYYANPTNPSFEMILVYILLAILSFMTNKNVVVVIACFYTFIVYSALFPSGEFDKLAADKFWGKTVEC